MAARAASTGQTDQTRDLGAGTAEWSAWYAQYLTRTTGQSARTLELFQQVLEYVAKGEIAPTALQDLLPAFAQARGAEYSNKFAQLSYQFFSSLVQVGGVYSQEQAELLTPGFAVPDVGLPQFDSVDPARWFQQLTDYAGQLSARASKAYQSHLQRVAAGETSPGELQQATSDYLARRLPEHLRELGREYFELLNGLNDVRSTYEQDYLSGVLATSKRPDHEAAFILNLVGPLGGTASAALSLANSRAEQALIRCSVTEIRRGDGIGPAFPPNVTFAPDVLELAPGEEGSLRLTILLDQDRFDPAATYVGGVHITGHGEPRIEVPLRISVAGAAPNTNGAIPKGPP